MGQAQQDALTNFYMLTLMLTAREYPVSVAEDLRKLAVAVVTQMEEVLPVCESGVLRHLLIHIAERVQVAGPPWVHAMWPWERMWGRLVKWVHQGKNPAASIMNTYLTYSGVRHR